MDCRLPGSSVHGVLPARILECVAISLLRESSRTRDWTHDSYMGRQVLYPWATWEVHTSFYKAHISRPPSSAVLPTHQPMSALLLSLPPSPLPQHPVSSADNSHFPGVLFPPPAPLPTTELSALISLTPGGWPLQRLSYLSVRDWGPSQDLCERSSLPSSDSGDTVYSSDPTQHLLCSRSWGNGRNQSLYSGASVFSTAKQGW